GCEVPSTCPYTTDPYYRLGFASMDFSLSITNDHFMKYVAAHEFGHTMVLNDCNYCDTTATVMTKYTIVLNDPSAGLTAPGTCDNLQVMNSDVALFLGPPSINKPLSATLVASSRDADARVKS